MDYNEIARSGSGCDCCAIRLLSGWMSVISGQLGEINDKLCQMNGQLCGMSEQLCAIEQSVAGNQTALYTIYATLATNNPMSVAAEYPTQEENKVTYSITRVLLTDMLNPELSVLFKQPLNIALPVYFKDLSNYEHVVTFGDTVTQALSSQLVNNFAYPALYVGNYIILNPTLETLENFKNGLIN